MKNEANETIIDGIKVYSSNSLETGTYATLINSKFYNSTKVKLNSYSVAYNNTAYGDSVDINIQTGSKAYNNTF